MGQVAVLFARSDSIYKSMPVCDVYDFERDALNFSGGLPVVAHPPCRAWGRLRHFAKPRDGEKELALFAVDSVIENGGVLEHPAGSSLWKCAGLPEPNKSNGKGMTIQVNQHWYGHRADKSTWLFINGLELCQIPPAPLVFSESTHIVGKSSATKAELPKSEREKTPIKFAEFLIDIAQAAGAGH